MAYYQDWSVIILSAFVRIVLLHRHRIDNRRSFSLLQRDPHSHVVPPVRNIHYTKYRILERRKKISQPTGEYD